MEKGLLVVLTPTAFREAVQPVQSVQSVQSVQPAG